MIPGDEGKPMSIMERISDEPCEPEAYIDYLLTNWKSHREHWASLSETLFDPIYSSTKACVLSKIDSFMIELENIKRKMHRKDTNE